MAPQKLLERYNEDYTRSLVVIQNGTAKALSRTISPAIGCRFKARSPELYCLKTDVIEQNGQYQEELFLSVINLETTKEIPLLALPNYSDVQMSVFSRRHCSAVRSGANDGSESE